MPLRLRASLVAVALAAAGLALSLPTPPARAATFPNLTKLSPTGGWATPTYAANYSQIGEQFSTAAVGDVVLRDCSH